MTKKALITGICGQDAAYMAQLLLSKGYEVYGIGRTIVDYKLWRLNHLGIKDKVMLINGDITDGGFLFEVFEDIQPDECYNFAAISFVGQSWKIPHATLQINTNGVLNILKAIKHCSPKTRLYQAGSSEMFGRPEVKQQNESVSFAPCNPYGVSKVAAHQYVDIYRTAFDIFACNAICYNHESPLRGIEYVTRKITDGVAKIKLGLSKELRLGNIESRRDWGYAGDYVKAMWAMLQQDTPGDYVLATGQTHSIKDFLSAAFSEAGLDNWEQYVVQDERFYRPLEPHLLCGDNAKAQDVLSWKPEMTFENMVAAMVKRDLEHLQKKV